MKLYKALIILEEYNNWRRDNSIPLPNKYEMPDPKQIGMAIDVILECHKKQMDLVQSTKLRLQEAQKDWDQENAHIEGDKALCDLLKGFGFNDVVKEFEDINKWYA